ncbi:hypothetical protein ACXR2U_22705 [Jatrophihabitans sp. YIM 134969]
MSTTPPDDLGPVAAPVRRPRWHRTLAITIVAVAAVALGSGATWLVLRDDRPGLGATDGGICPSSVPVDSGVEDGDSHLSLRDQVPDLPTVPHLGDRLVPSDDPTEVVLCEYRPPYGGGIAPDGTGGSGSPAPSAPSAPDPQTSDGSVLTDLPLGRTAAHDATDASVAPLLTALHGATLPQDGFFTCGGLADVRAPQYLVRLTYDDGVVWLAGPALCTTTNGAGVSNLDLSGPVDWALNHATATERPSPVASPSAPGLSPHCGGIFVSPMDEGSAVPFPPVTVEICHNPPGSTPGGTVVRRGDEVAQQLADLITGSPAATAPASGCGDDELDDRWELTFRSAEGETATVYVLLGTCPGVFDGNHRGDPSDALVALLQASD